MTKAELYRWIAEQREKLRLTDIPVYAPSLVRERYPDITLREKDFATRSLGGMILLGKVSLLYLNSLRTEIEHNFDCAHELVHYWSGGGHYALSPVGILAPEQDAYTEWIANEGAAELLMPYRRVIPLFYHEQLTRLKGAARREKLQTLASQFLVTPAQMEYRLRSLERELAQYAEHLRGGRIIPQARGKRPVSCAEGK